MFSLVLILRFVLNNAHFYSKYCFPKDTNALNEYMKREGVQFPLRGYADGGVVSLLNNPDYDRMQNTNSYYGAF